MTDFLRPPNKPTDISLQMRSVIQQSVSFSASAETLFAQYTDATLHSSITGAPVEIGVTPGARFRAFDGVLQGTILAVVEPVLVVQSWRSSEFRSDDPDSTLILCFRDEAGQGRIDLVHLDVPAHDFDGVTQGWEKYYWTPWRAFLASN